MVLSQTDSGGAAPITKWITVTVNANVTKAVSLPYTVWTTSQVSTTLVTTKPTTKQTPEWKKDLLNQLDNILSSPKWKAILNSGRFNTHSLLNKVRSVRNAIIKAKTRDEGGKVLGDFINFVDSTYQNLIKEDPTVLKKMVKEAQQRLKQMINQEVKAITDVAAIIRAHISLSNQLLRIADELKKAKTYGDLKNALTRLKILEPQIDIALAGAKLSDTISSIASSVDDSNLRYWLAQESAEALRATSISELKTITSEVNERLKKYYERNRQKVVNEVKAWFNSLPSQVKEVVRPNYIDFLKNPNNTNYNQLIKATLAAEKALSIQIPTPQIPGYLSYSEALETFEANLSNIDQGTSKGLPKNIQEALQGEFTARALMTDVGSELWSWLDNAQQYFYRMGHKKGATPLDKVLGFLGYEATTVGALPLGAVAGIAALTTPAGWVNTYRFGKELVTNPGKVGAGLWQQLTQKPALFIPWIMGQLLGGYYLSKFGGFDKVVRKVGSYFRGPKVGIYGKVPEPAEVSGGQATPTDFFFKAYEEGLAKLVGKARLKNGDLVGYSKFIYDPETGITEFDQTLPGKIIRVIIDPKTKKAYTYVENLKSPSKFLERIKSVFTGNKGYAESETTYISDLSQLDKEQAEALNKFMDLGRLKKELESAYPEEKPLYESLIKQTRNKIYNELIEKLGKQLGTDAYNKGKLTFIRLYRWEKGKLAPEELVPEDYVIYRGASGVKAYRINPDGSITEVDPKTGAPLSKAEEIKETKPTNTKPVSNKGINNKGFSKSFYRDLLKTNLKNEYNKGVRAGVPDEALNKYVSEMNTKLNEGKINEYEDLATWLKKNGYDEYAKSLNKTKSSSEGLNATKEGESQVLQKLGDELREARKELTNPEKAIQDLRQLGLFSIKEGINPNVMAPVMDALITSSIAQSIINYASGELGAPVTSPNQLTQLGLTPQMANIILEKAGATSGTTQNVGATPTSDVLRLKEWVEKQKKQQTIRELSKSRSKGVMSPNIRQGRSYGGIQQYYMVNPEKERFRGKGENELREILQPRTKPVTTPQSGTRAPAVTATITQYVRVTKLMANASPTRDIWVQRQVTIPVELTEWITQPLTQPIKQPITAPIIPTTPIKTPVTTPVTTPLTQTTPPKEITIFVPVYYDEVVPTFRVVQKYVQEGQQVPPPGPNESPLPIFPLMPPLTPGPMPAGLGKKGKVKRGHQYEVIEL